MAAIPNATLGQVKRQAYEIYIYDGPTRYVLQIKNGFRPGVFLDGVKIANLDKDKMTYIEARFELPFPEGTLDCFTSCRHALGLFKQTRAVMFSVGGQVLIDKEVRC
jgi:hypothetical protein